MLYRFAYIKILRSGGNIAKSCIFLKVLLDLITDHKVYVLFYIEMYYN